MSTQFTINNIASMERWPEKSAGVLRPFCGRIALIFLDFWLLFCQEKSKKEKTVDQNKSAIARINLETFYGHDNYCDCYNYGGNKSAEASFANEDKEDSPLMIEASPNPATHYVEFTYELSEVDKDGMIIITDINGKQIQSFAVKYSKGVQAWDTRKIPAGAYIYTLKTKYFENSGKLIIQ